jgi:hypothetical protein
VQTTSCWGSRSNAAGSHAGEAKRFATAETMCFRSRLIGPGLGVGFAAAVWLYLYTMTSTRELRFFMSDIDTKTMIAYVERVCGAKLAELTDAQIGRGMTEWQLDGLTRALQDPAMLTRIGEGFRKNIQNPIYIERMMRANDVMIPGDEEIN